MFETQRIDAFSVIITYLPMSMLQDPIPLIIIVMYQCTRIALKELRMSNENLIWIEEHEKVGLFQKRLYEILLTDYMRFYFLIL